MSRSALHSRAARAAFSDVGADDAARAVRQSLDALNALGLRAELLVEHDVLELRQPVLKPHLKIGLVEELRVGRAARG